MKRVFNFSGGQTSAYMVSNYYKPGDIVIFCDTGREHPKTYKFINDFEAYTGIPIHKISLNNHVDAFAYLLEKKGNSSLPNIAKRYCTIELKIVVAKRFLRSIGIQTFENFIGFRYDEKERQLKRKNDYKKVFDRFPLIDDKVTLEHINGYWLQQPFKLEIPRILGNCTLCFMKGKNAIISILSHYPELAEPWIKDEEKVCKQKSGKRITYIKGVSIQELLNIANSDMFSKPSLNSVISAFNCSCGL